MRELTFASAGFDVVLLLVDECRIEVPRHVATMNGHQSQAVQLLGRKRH